MKRIGGNIEVFLLRVHDTRVNDVHKTVQQAAAVAFYLGKSLLSILSKNKKSVLQMFSITTGQIQIWKEETEGWVETIFSSYNIMPQIQSIEPNLYEHGISLLERWESVISTEKVV